MASLTGKPPSGFYKDLVHISNNNSGVDATTRQLYDGAGNVTAIYLSDDVFKIQPNTDNTTGAFLVNNQSGNAVLSVDTANSKILGGASQTSLNTQYTSFGIGNSASATFAVDTHYAIPFLNGVIASGFISMGSSTSSSFNDTDPATSLTVSTTASNDVQCYWYVMDDITIDSVKWLHAADAATGEDTAAHLMAYTVDIANGSTGGDLSSGAVVADGATITNAGREQIYYQSMTIQSADVDAGKVILFTFASDTINSDYTINATVKYHIR